MTLKIYIAVIFLITLFMIISLSYKRGKDAEAIKRLKEEIKNRAREQANANQKVDLIHNLSNNAVNERLQDLASQQRNNMRKS